MKKLTTGIFTVVLGLVAADASAAVTSKAYVDARVGAVDTKVDGLETTVNDFKTNIGDTITQEIKTNLESPTSDIAKALDAKADASDVTALGTRVTTAEGEIDTLQATVSGLTTGDGSVANQIAGALADYTNTTDMNAALSLKADKATTYTKTEVDTAVADAKKAGTDAASALTAYQTTNNAAVQKNASDITALDTAYKAADKAINAKIGTVAEGKTVVEMITEAAAGAGYDDAAVKADIKKYADAISAMDTAYKAADTELTTAVEKAQSDATKGITDAAAAQATANAAIPAPTGPCENPTNKCVLTFAGGNTYAWEVIEREGGQ